MSHACCIFWFLMQQTGCRGRSALNCVYFSLGEMTLRPFATPVKPPFCHTAAVNLQECHVFDTLLSTVSESHPRTKHTRASVRVVISNTPGHYVLLVIH